MITDTRDRAVLRFFAAFTDWKITPQTITLETAKILVAAGIDAATCAEIEARRIHDADAARFEVKPAGIVAYTDSIGIAMGIRKIEEILNDPDLTPIEIRVFGKAFP